MITFKTISWKNFLSTGNTAIKVNLDEAPTTLVIGKNGSGKSTLLDALCFVLFNRPFRIIKKDQIVNSINDGVKSLNSSRFFSGLMMVMLNIYQDKNLMKVLVNVVLN